MSFLKDLKDDLAQAVNELVTDEEVEVTDKKDNKKQKNKKGDSSQVQSKNGTDNVINEEMDSLDLNKVNSMLDAIDEELAQNTSSDSNKLEEEVNKETVAKEVKAEEIVLPEDNEKLSSMDDMIDTLSDEGLDSTFADEMSMLMNEEGFVEEEKLETEVKELEVMDDEIVDTIEEVASDEVTEITKGTVITGNISSIGSMNVYGSITGDISCKGKMIVTGTVKGTAEAREIFANNAKIEGDIKSDGTVKIGNGTVIVGNVVATSAVIGGAIKGDIDVNGPVIVDSTAIVKGNIKSKSVQINNGAVIDGFCSQAYADIDYKTLFEDTFVTK